MIINFTQLIKIIRARKIITITLVAAVFLVGRILQTDLAPDLYFLHWGPLEDVSCHYIETGDALPIADGEFSPSPRSIFFHETSCKGDLGPRQACAIESAARAHPQWQINVLFSAPIPKFTLQRGSLAKLNRFGNVKFSRVILRKYARGTPLESLVNGGALNRTRWRIAHASDVLRYLSLYKWGGVYLDLDVVVARPLGLARNWAARESGSAVAAGAMAFSRDHVGRAVAEAAIEDIRANYRGDVWGQNGPGVITRVLQRQCCTSDADVMSSATCNGFEVYGPQFFYPITWQNARDYFEPGELTMLNAYVYHVWNQFSSQYKVYKGSPYAKLAKKFCPMTYNLYKSHFGS